MFNYSVGLSGLQLAQRAMDLVGANVANATTPGYHRQELETAAITLGQSAGASIAGVEVLGVRRNVDRLLEQEMIRQQSSQGLTDQKLSVFETIESALGGVGTQGLGAALTSFFQALSELPTQPQSQALQEQVVWAADGMAKEFHNLAGLLANTRTQMGVQANTLVDQVNALAERIAKGNIEVARASTSGMAANVAQDNRDQAISELSQLVEVDVTNDPNIPGVRNVSVGGALLVLGGKSVSVEAGLNSDGVLGISPAGSGIWITDLRGGRLGAVMQLANEDIPGLSGQLDALASDLIAGINRLHVQGVGSAGSFGELTGTVWPTGVLADWAPGVTAGTIQVRVIDKTTGDITRHAITVDPATDTLATVGARLGALAHMSSSVVASALHLEADPGYAFDFVPALQTEPIASTLTGTAAATIGGVYTGSENRTYTCTVVGTGQVGVTDGLSVEVRDPSGALVKTINVGSGYAAGDSVEAAAGIQVSLSTGTLKNGETFGIEALADTDTSGFLAAAGLNTFFRGGSASTIDVRQELKDSPGRVATSMGPLLSDGGNVDRMAAIGWTGREALDGATPSDYYQRLVTRVGQMVSTTKATQKSIDAVVQQIAQQREAVSGVDVNEQAALLMTYERMYQGMARFISTLDKSMSYLMEIV